jgi:hypothetical protein
LIDFALQNALIFFYFLYYFKEEPFINQPAKSAFLAFLIIYLIATYLPRLIMALTTRDDVYDEDSFENQRKSCKRFFRKFFKYLFFMLMAII